MEVLPPILSPAVEAPLAILFTTTEQPANTACHHKGLSPSGSFRHPILSAENRA